MLDHRCPSQPHPPRRAAVPPTEESRWPGQATAAPDGATAHADSPRNCAAESYAATQPASSPSPASAPARAPRYTTSPLTLTGEPTPSSSTGKPSSSGSARRVTAASLPVTPQPEPTSAPESYGRRNDIPAYGEKCLLTRQNGRPVQLASRAVPVGLRAGLLGGPPQGKHTGQGAVGAEWMLAVVTLEGTLSANLVTLLIRCPAIVFRPSSSVAPQHHSLFAIRESCCVAAGLAGVSWSR